MIFNIADLMGLYKPRKTLKHCKYITYSNYFFNFEEFSCDKLRYFELIDNLNIQLCLIDSDDISQLSFIKGNNRLLI